MKFGDVTNLIIAENSNVAVEFKFHNNIKHWAKTNTNCWK